MENGLKVALFLAAALIVVAIIKRRAWSQAGGEFVAAVIGVVILGFYTTFSYQQAVATHAAVEQGNGAAVAAQKALEQSTRAADSARDQAKSAADQATTASDTEKRQLRAYVGVIPTEIENFGVDTQRLLVLRKNYGQTPAYAVGIAIYSTGMDILRNDTFPPLLPAGSFCTGTNPAPTRAGSLFPSQELPYYINVPRKFTADQIRSVKSATTGANPDPREYSLVYWGALCYQDAFRTVHYTNFCYMFRGKSMTGRDAHVCLINNDSD